MGCLVRVHPVGNAGHPMLPKMPLSLAQSILMQCGLSIESMDIRHVLGGEVILSQEAIRTALSWAEPIHKYATYLKSMMEEVTSGSVLGPTLLKIEFKDEMGKGIIFEDLENE